MGGASGAAFRNPLTGTGHNLEELIAREAIQNSSDAAAYSNGALSVDFWFRTVPGGAKARLVEAMRLRSSSLHHAGSHLAPDNTFANLDNDEVPLRLLYIDDWGTHGLSGPVHDDKESAHFFKFALAIGDADKASSAVGSGGSYGYGKSVFASASDIDTIFIYTVFEPTEESDGAHARLMGLSWFDKHRIGKVSYTGRGWFGEPNPDAEGEVEPLIDEEAHKVAEVLGFSRREPDETGLSILIVGSTLSIDRLREGIETHWWPRLEDRSLDVRIFENGAAAATPRPMKRPDLKPFISCYRKADGLDDVNPPLEASGKLQAVDGIEPGIWVATALDDKDLNDEDDNGLVNTVALMRTPRMVVEYIRVGRPYRIPVAGVFIASAEADQSLKLSEPPAHDKWDPNSARLTDASDRNLVEKILIRLKANIQRFQDGLQPKEETAGDRIAELEKALGSLFRHQDSNRPPPPPPGPVRPVEVRLAESRVPQGNEAVGRATVRIKLRDEAEIDEDSARISGVFEVLAQDTQNVDGSLATTITSYPPSGVLAEGAREIDVKVVKGEWTEIEFESARFDSDWLVRFSLNAEKNLG